MKSGASKVSDAEKRLREFGYTDAEMNRILTAKTEVIDVLKREFEAKKAEKRFSEEGKKAQKAELNKIDTTLKKPDKSIFSKVLDIASTRYNNHVTSTMQENSLMVTSFVLQHCDQLKPLLYKKDPLRQAWAQVLKPHRAHFKGENTIAIAALKAKGQVIDDLLIVANVKSTEGVQLILDEMKKSNAKMISEYEAKLANPEADFQKRVDDATSNAGIEAVLKNSLTTTEMQALSKEMSDALPPDVKSKLPPIQLQNDGDAKLVFPDAAQAKAAKEALRAIGLKGTNMSGDKQIVVNAKELAHFLSNPENVKALADAIKDFPTYTPQPLVQQIQNVAPRSTGAQDFTNMSSPAPLVFSGDRVKRSNTVVRTDVRNVFAQDGATAASTTPTSPNKNKM